MLSLFRTPALSEIKTAAKLAEIQRIARTLFWAEVEERFGQKGKSTGIRRGWKVVDISDSCVPEACKVCEKKAMCAGSLAKAMLGQ